ncbi:hypothetical protein [Acidithiobacillus sulfurivorans]|uniref:Uncharacterized protein n=1 Tax=Acidithiobacillus sulfurivorans TaxID=1958756 RepID=A0ABS6A0D9_9PROT|nr:hypothetical protein [Acidithiobacillus sulfurivorans]MBU2760937.1 hypothetical protein [Acidithiobacillus sulfurivorans]
MNGESVVEEGSLMAIKKPRVPKITALRPDYFSWKGEDWDMGHFFKQEFLREAKGFLKKLTTTIEGVQASFITTTEGGQVCSGEQRLWVSLSDQPEKPFGLKIIVQQVGQCGRASDGIGLVVQPLHAPDKLKERHYAARWKACPASIQKLAQGKMGNNHWFPSDQEITVDNVTSFVNRIAEGICRKEKTK